MYGEHNARRANLAFSTACIYGHESVAGWLIDMNWLDIRNADYIPRLAAERGMFRLAKRLFNRYVPYFREHNTLAAHKAYAFTNACRRRCIWFIRWLDKTYGLTLEDVRDSNMAAFSAACWNGDWSLARWMAIRFELTRKHIRDAGCAPLENACVRGHLHVVRWLVESFHLTARDVRCNHNSAFTLACATGSLDVVQWLTERFHLTTLDVVSEQNRALTSASRNGHEDVVRWLMWRFGLGREGARVNPTRLLVYDIRMASDTLEWLLTVLGLGRHGQAKLHRVLIEFAADEKRVEFTRQMAKRFGVIPYDVELALDAYKRRPVVTALRVARAQRWSDAFAAEW